MDIQSSVLLYLSYQFNDVFDIDDLSLNKELIKCKIDDIENGGTSGNAFLINKENAYVWQWYPESYEHPTYFTMQLNKSEKATYISSEVIPWLGVEGYWEPIKNYSLLEFNLKESQ